MDWNTQTLPEALKLKLWLVAHKVAVTNPVLLVLVAHLVTKQIGGNLQQQPCLIACVMSIAW